ncbi:hypothetical protein D3C85_804690 [compost metagenome]
MLNVKDFGAFGDGLSHTLASTTVFQGVNTTGWSLTQWQTYFPSATNLSQEIDYLAHVAAIAKAVADNAPTQIYAPAGRYRLGTGEIVVATRGISIVGDGPGSTVWLSSKPDGDIFTFRNMSAGGISAGNIVPLVARTDGAAVAFVNGHNLVSRDMQFDPGYWHGGTGEHFACYEMIGGADQFLYTVEHFEMNHVRFGIRIGRHSGYVQDMWIGKGTIVARETGIQAYHVGGLYIYNMPSSLTCRVGLQCVPGVGQTVSGMMVSGYLADTCENHGVDIAPNGGSVVDFQLTDLWASSSGTTVPGSDTSPNHCGINIDGSNGYVGGGIITSPRCIGNVSHGMRIQHASEITISNPQFNYNSVRSYGSFNGLMIDNGCENITVVGGFSGATGKFKDQPGLPPTQNYGAFIWSGAKNVKITNLDVSANINAGIPALGPDCFVLQPGEGLVQRLSERNTLGSLGVGRSPLPGYSIAAKDHITLAGDITHIGFNAYWDYNALVWKYQGNGAAYALRALPAGLELIRFGVNASGVDAVASIVSTGKVQAI